VPSQRTMTVRSSHHAGSAGGMRQHLVGRSFCDAGHPVRRSSLLSSNSQDRSHPARALMHARRPIPAPGVLSCETHRGAATVGAAMCLALHERSASATTTSCARQLRRHERRKGSAFGCCCRANLGRALPSCSRARRMFPETLRSALGCRGDRQRAAEPRAGRPAALMRGWGRRSCSRTTLALEACLLPRRRAHVSRIAWQLHLAHDETVMLRRRDGSARPAAPCPAPWSASARARKPGRRHRIAREARSQEAARRGRAACGVRLTAAASRPSSLPADGAYRSFA
jgi:hypothetical protein